MEENQKNKILEFLGCGDHERKTLDTLFGFPNGASVVEISKKTNTTRTTIYGHVESLFKKGLLKKLSRNKTTIYAPQPTGVLKEMFDEKIESLKKYSRIINNLLVNENLVSVPKFSVHEGKKTPNPILLDMLRDSEEIFSIWPIEIMLDVIDPEEFEYFHKQRIKRGIKLNVLWSEDAKIKLSDHPFLDPENNSLREIRILPKGLNPGVGYSVYGTKVSMISNNNESFSFIVESQEFSKTLKNQFDYLWRLSRKYSE